MAWNAGHGGVAAAPVVALDWSITAMTEAAERLAAAPEWDLPSAVVAVSEATWWVTIVDATLVRYHPRTYDAVLAGRPSGYRRATEETLAGLRHVRNQMGHRLDPSGFIRPAAPGRSRRGAAAWAWNPLPEPARDSLTPHGDEWELTRYRAYQARLADRDVAQTFALTTSFLGQAAIRAAPDAPMPGSVPAARQPGSAR